ncbi:hypothetical protein CEXT_555881 [Caerostris extrusa]|uniref:Uncharacterized protein n=1 Tax=Caerostris extrusa TaxID=172846 RepID=A0AAV4N7K3_CAEEX|nr:hypothetical protein CEXT_555881 [Caerostris extrusa]
MNSCFIVIAALLISYFMSSHIFYIGFMSGELPVQSNTLMVLLAKNLLTVLLITGATIHKNWFFSITQTIQRAVARIALIRRFCTGLVSYCLAQFEVDQYL